MTGSDAPPFATLAVDSHVATVTLNRPDKHNAMNAAMRDELKAHFAAIRDDRDVRVVLLIGAGASFSSGQDLKERSGLRPIESADAKWAQEDFQGLLERLPQPVIAALRGYCFGRGIEVALTCDLRIASTTMKIRFPEVRLGMIPASGGTQRLTRHVGMARAMDIILTGRDVEAEEALRLGLVTSVVADDRLETEAASLARRIAEQAPLATRLAKRAIKEGGHLPLREGLALEGYLASLLMISADRAEGLTAFLERRPPEWRNE
jgi:enoyl-CoA hydratase/carnithine racemase